MKYLRHQDFLIKVGDRIRSLRVSKEISQEELSFRTEISRNQIGRIERGEINAGLSTIYEIAKGLETSICEIFNDIV